MLYSADGWIFYQGPNQEVCLKQCPELGNNGRALVYHQVGRRVLLYLCLAICAGCVSG